MDQHVPSCSVNLHQRAEDRLTDKTPLALEKLGKYSRTEKKQLLKQKNSENILSERSWRIVFSVTWNALAIAWSDIGQGRLVARAPLRGSSRHQQRRAGAEGSAHAPLGLGGEEDLERDEPERAWGERLRGEAGDVRELARVEPGLERPGEGVRRRRRPGPFGLSA
jgi:hypothetical protein